MDSLRESIDESKENLRRRLKGLRDALSAEEVLARSRKIERRLFASSLLDPFASVALYASFGSEVATEGIFLRLREKGCRTFLPRVAGERIEFVPVSDWGRLTPGRWAIPEPAEGRGEPADAFEAVLVPGIAFDEAGARLGFGKGFYDRSLAGFRGRKIGLAYDFQVLPKIPRTGNDLVCHWVVTEARTVRGSETEEPSWNLKRL